MVFFSCIVLQQANSSVNYPDVFNKIQRLMRAKDEIYGEGNYECYSNGECVMEYKMGDLVTYREESLCARSEEGCGESLSKYQKREELCNSMEEEYMTACERSQSENCDRKLEDMEEQSCLEVRVEKRKRERRAACHGLSKRFAQGLCGGSGKKRSISEECQLVMELMEEEDCMIGGNYQEDLVEFEKREKTCIEGWSKSGKVCYKYYTGPVKYERAKEFCETLTNDKSSHLATLERAITMGPENTKFFQDLIESSGAIEKIDGVLSQMSDHYVDGDWQSEKKYYDNWAWVGVKKVNDVWSWVSAKKEPADWNPVTYGQPDWVKGMYRQPSEKNDTAIRMDHGNCVAYFQEPNSDKDMGSWWNAGCGVQLPFICEMDPVD